MRKSPKRVVELEATQLSQEVQANPMYGVAMLKIAMELKRAPEGELNGIVKGVLERMRLDEPAFRRFLDQNGGLLRAIAQKKEY
jgi:hypothetical protein